MRPSVPTSTWVLAGLSVRRHIKTTSTGEISSVEDTTARDDWIQGTHDEQVYSKILACKLALVTSAQEFLTSTDSEVFLRGARAFTLQHPPVQRVADVSERIEDLPDMSDADLDRMREIRDAARSKVNDRPKGDDSARSD